MPLTAGPRRRPRLPSVRAPLPPPGPCRPDWGLRVSPLFCARTRCSPTVPVSDLSFTPSAVLASFASLTPIPVNDRGFFLSVPPPQTPVSASQACLAADAPGDAPDGVPWDQPAPHLCAARGRRNILLLGTKSACCSGGSGDGTSVFILPSRPTARWLGVEFGIESFFLTSIKATLPTSASVVGMSGAIMVSSPLTYALLLFGALKSLPLWVTGVCLVVVLSSFRSVLGGPFVMKPHVL